MANVGSTFLLVISYQLPHKRGRVYPRLRDFSLNTPSIIYIWKSQAKSSSMKMTPTIIINTPQPFPEIHSNFFQLLLVNPRYSQFSQLFLDIFDSCVHFQIHLYFQLQLISFKIYLALGVAKQLSSALLNFVLLNFTS